MKSEHGNTRSMGFQDVIPCVGSVPVFQSNLLPPSSRQKSDLIKYSVASQKHVFSIFTIMRTANALW
jgi:hypothetical protein